MYKGVSNELAKLKHSDAEVADCIERMGRAAVLGFNRVVKQHLAVE